MKAGDLGCEREYPAKFMINGAKIPSMLFFISIPVFHNKSQDIATYKVV